MAEGVGNAPTSARADPVFETGAASLYLPAFREMVRVARLALASSSFRTCGRVLTACSESSSRREEALISLLFPRKFEPRYLGCYG